MRHRRERARLERERAHLERGKRGATEGLSFIRDARRDERARVGFARARAADARTVTTRWRKYGATRQCAIASAAGGAPNHATPSAPS